VDAPHDFIAEYGKFTDNSEDLHHGSLPRNVSFYRKHFYLPTEWESDGGATFVHFEGVFHHATFFLNGQYLMSHECGYTGFDVRLDNATNIRFGPNAQNVLTLRADASFGSGHWYEGGGIYRPVHLEHVASTHITRNGLFVPPEGDGSSIAASAELETVGKADSKAWVVFSLFELEGTVCVFREKFTLEGMPLDHTHYPELCHTPLNELQSTCSRIRHWITRMFA
jgi:beta-galactosidase/beta-glucuronidase